MPSTVDPPSIQPQLDANAAKIKKRIDDAVAAASQRLADSVETEVRADIAGAGNFGPRWTSGFTAKVDSASPSGATVTFNMGVPYWRIFATGGTIFGKPLLWLPFSDDKTERPYPGRLFFVQPKSGGAPLMISAIDKKPKLHGHPSVRIPKKFAIFEIINAQTKTFGPLYRAEMKKQ